jgi:type IV pilus assembly protein PilP
VISMKIFKSLSAALLAIPLVGLSGCAEKSDDLDEFMRTAREQPGGKLESLPELLPPESFTYSAAGSRSPFQMPNREEKNDTRNSVPAPDTMRPKEVLENFSMDQLSMVGTLQNENSKLWALVSAGDKDVYRVTEGNYLGRNHGKIIKVSLDKMDIMEVVPDGKGGWLGRPKTMEIIEK